jgi:murein L,D-transpeptidase YcbB/YkuD
MIAVLATTLLLALALASPTSPWRARGAAAGDDAPADSIVALLRRRLAAPEAAGLLSPELVTRFYDRRGYVPAWSRETAVGRQAEALVGAVRGAEAEGLNPREYHLAEVEEALRRVHVPASNGGPLDPSERATIDLLLTDAFVTYGGHLAHGRIDPKRIHSGWSLPPRQVDVIAALERAIQDGRIEETLAGLAPSTPEYGALRQALQRYRGIEERGGWPVLPSGFTLRPGDRGNDVSLLRARLAAETRLVPADSPTVYDPALEEAVRVFQRTRGLREDAEVGPATRAALNVGVRSRVEQIALSMERLRWLPDDLGRRHIRVSIPAFELVVVEEGRAALAMRVVGGRPDWRTPIFSARMTSVVLSPYWNIPPSIAEAEVLPRARRDPDYLRRNGIRWVRDGSEYRLRQDPGPLNPLGQVKFLFPNPYNVYLHDTPSRHLFAEPLRAYSHGCMRVERPLDLAEYVLRDLGWDRDAIRRGMARGVERAITLSDPVPVYVLYQTAWVDAAEQIEFRDDVYGHDRRLAEAIAGRIRLTSERVSGECIVTTNTGVDARGGYGG